jgi:RNA polymerase sigma-70 factor (ECF subfamily)
MEGDKYFYTIDQQTPSLAEEKVFELIFKAYYPRLKAFSTKFIADPAVVEDVIQEVFLKIWENKENIRTETFRSYVFTMVRNACLNHLKHEKIVSNYAQAEEDSANHERLYYADFFSDPHHQTIYNELRREIDKVMGTLPEQTQTVFELSRFRGMKNHEIAQKLGITTRTVEKHITRALTKLRAHFPETYLIVLTSIELWNN